MVNLLMIIIVTLVVTGIGGAGAYIIWLWTRPKKMTWNAKVYQVGEAIRQKRIKDKNASIQLADLKPYTKDVIEKIYKAPGITLFRLIKLNKCVDGVPSDCVEYWGSKDQEVSVLLEGETATVLRKGYEHDAGEIFQPMPHDRINLIKSEIAIRKDRLRKEKDILEAITPWIVTGMTMMALIAIAWLVITGFQEMGKSNNEAAKYTADKLIEAAQIINSASGAKIIPTDTKPEKIQPG